MAGVTAGATTMAASSAQDAPADMRSHRFGYRPRFKLCPPDLIRHAASVTTTEPIAGMSPSSRDVGLLPARIQELISRSSISLGGGTASRRGSNKRASDRRPEAPVGIEPTNRGFADLCLTTWLRRQLIAATRT